MKLMKHTRKARWMKGWTWQPRSWMNLGSCPCEPSEPRSLGLGIYRCAQRSQSLRAAATCALLSSPGLFRGPVLVVVVDENLHIWVNRSQGGAQMHRDKFSFFLGGAMDCWQPVVPTFCNELLVNASTVSTYSPHGSESAYLTLQFDATDRGLWFLRINSKAKPL